MNVKLITDSSQMHSQFLQLKRCFDCANIEIDGFLMLAYLVDCLLEFERIKYCEYAGNSCSLK